MSDRILIPLSDGRWLALTQQDFAAALSAGAQAMNTPRGHDTETPAAAELLTAKEMEQRTGVPRSWWLTQARERRIPHQHFGRYVRFDPVALAQGGFVPVVTDKQ